ncbi:MAG: NADH-quinone oxidoreductase subunit A [bacterium]
MSEYLAVLMFILVGSGIVLFTFLFARIMRPHNPYPAKNLNYECAELPIGSSWIKLHNRFYIFALIFVIFDVEVVFLFPWAVAFGQLGLFALVEMVVFILILFLGSFMPGRRECSSGRNQACPRPDREIPRRRDCVNIALRYPHPRPGLLDVVPVVWHRLLRNRTNVHRGLAL